MLDFSFKNVIEKCWEFMKENTSHTRSWRRTNLVRTVFPLRTFRKVEVLTQSYSVTPAAPLKNLISAAWLLEWVSLINHWCLYVRVGRYTDLPTVLHCSRLDPRIRYLWLTSENTKYIILSHHLQAFMFLWCKFHVFIDSGKYSILCEWKFSAYGIIPKLGNLPNRC